MATAKFLLQIMLMISTVLAATCNTNQFRKAGDPSGQQISNSLFGPNHTTLNMVCNGGFPPGSNTTATFNTGSLTYTITRSNATSPLQNCQTAFGNIIQQCIASANYWGGSWSFSGDVYTISNSQWPSFNLPGISSTTSGGTITPFPSQTTVVATISGSAITETFVPVTVSGVTAATSTSTNIAGIIVPLILGPLGIGWIPFVPIGGVPPVPVFPPPLIPGDGGNPSVTNHVSTTIHTGTSTGSVSSSTQTSTARFCSLRPRSSSVVAPPSSTKIVSTTLATSTVIPPVSVPQSIPPPPSTVVPPPITTSTTSTTATAVFPSNTGINCGQSTVGGARISDCLEALSSVEIPNDDTQICTNAGGDTCISSGVSLGGDPLVQTSSYCSVGGNSGCAVVIANKLSSFGFPGFSCVSGADLNTFIKDAANACNNGLDAYAIAQGPNGYDSLCLVGSQDPGLCGA